MNLKQIENSRLIILLSLIFYGCFKNISGNDLEQLSILLNTLSTTSLVLQSTLEKHASDYKKIKSWINKHTKLVNTYEYVCDFNSIEITKLRVSKEIERLIKEKGYMKV